MISTGSRYDEGNCSNVVQALDTWIKFREIIPGSELHDAIKKFATRLVASSEETLKEWGKMLLGSLVFKNKCLIS